MNIRKLLNPKCVFCASYYYLLKLINHFDEWHWKNNYCCRTYKKILVRELNKLSPFEVAVEIGGGLGEIIGRINANRRILIDLDERVIKAAKKNFLIEIDKAVVGSWEEAIKETPKDIDLLITVNWIHGISPKELKKNYKTFLRQKNVKLVVVDLLKTPWEGSYKHDFHFLESLGYKPLKRFDDKKENVREFIIFEKI